MRAVEREVMVPGSALLDAVVDDDVAVGHRGYMRHFVRHEDDCGRRREFRNYVIHAVFELLVEIAERFVEHKYLRVADDGAREQGALQLSARQAVESKFAPFLKAYAGDGVVHTLCAFVAAYILYGYEPRLDYLPHRDGEARVNHVFLREISHRQPVGGHAVVKISDGAGGGGYQFQYQAEQGGLSAAVGSGDGKEVATPYCEVDIFEYDFASAAQRHAVEGDYGVVSGVVARSMVHAVAVAAMTFSGRIIERGHLL